MNTYKIINITDKLGKRAANYNSTLKISYVDRMERKTMMLKPNEEVYFTTDSLPISLHKFRVKGFVSISDVTDKELRKLRNEEKKPTKVENTKKVVPQKPKSTSRGRPAAKKKTTPRVKKTESE
jgi:hypothetical protein